MLPHLPRTPLCPSSSSLSPGSSHPFEAHTFYSHERKSTMQPAYKSGKETSRLTLLRFCQSFQFFLCLPPSRLNSRSLLQPQVNTAIPAPHFEQLCCSQIFRFHAACLTIQLLIKWEEGALGDRGGSSQVWDSERLEPGKAPYQSAVRVLSILYDFCFNPRDSNSTELVSPKLRD